MTDLLVLGSGVAGLSAALHARAAGRSVLVLTKGELSHSATRYAQGGVAAALGEPDSPTLHLRDTLAAGAGLCDDAAVARPRHRRTRPCARAGRDRCRSSHDDDGDVAARRRRRPLARAGRARRRRRHRRRDRAGAGCGRARRRTSTSARAGSRSSCSSSDGRRAGVLALDPAANRSSVRATDTVLATGGAGQCFAVTTNPAAVDRRRHRVGAAGRRRVRRPRVRAVPPDRAAPSRRCRGRCSRRRLRGEGAVLRDDERRRVHGRRASARPISHPRRRRPRAIHAASATAGADHLWLDATMIDDFADALPDDLGRVPDASVSIPTRELAARSRPPRTTSRAGSSPTSTAPPTLPRPLGVRRGRVQRCARRQPARVELAARRAGLRRARRVPRSRAASAARADRRDGGRARERLSSDAPPPNPTCCRADRRAADARGASQRTMSSDVRGGARRRRPALAAKSLAALLDGAGSAAARRSPTYEVTNLAAVAARDRRRRARARLESRGRARPRRLPARPTDAQLGRLVQLGGDAAALRAPSALGDGRRPSRERRSTRRGDGRARGS